MRSRRERISTRFTPGWVFSRWSSSVANGSPVSSVFSFRSWAKNCVATTCPRKCEFRRWFASTFRRSATSFGAKPFFSWRSVRFWWASLNTTFCEFNERRTFVRWVSFSLDFQQGYLQRCKQTSSQSDEYLWSVRCDFRDDYPLSGWQSRLSMTSGERGGARSALRTLSNSPLILQVLSLIGVVLFIVFRGYPLNSFVNLNILLSFHWYVDLVIESINVYSVNFSMLLFLFCFVNEFSRCCLTHLFASDVNKLTIAVVIVCKRFETGGVVSGEYVLVNKQLTTCKSIDLFPVCQLHREIKVDEILITFHRFHSCPLIFSVIHRVAEQRDEWWSFRWLEPEM